jgi:hypothetical protein
VEIEWIWNDLEEKEDCEELSKVSYNCHLTVLGHRAVERCLLGNNQVEGGSYQVFYGAA